MAKATKQKTSKEANKNHEYLLLPNNIVESTELTPKAKKTLDALLYLSGMDKVKTNGVLFRTNKDLCKDAGLTEKHLIAALKELESTGYITRKAGMRGQASEYQIHLYKESNKDSNKDSVFVSDTQPITGVTPTNKDSNKDSNKESNRIVYFSQELNELRTFFENRLTLFAKSVEILTDKVSVLVEENQRLRSIVESFTFPTKDSTDTDTEVLDEVVLDEEVEEKKLEVCAHACETSTSSSSSSSLDVEQEKQEAYEQFRFLNRILPIADTEEDIKNICGEARQIKHLIDPNDWKEFNTKTWTRLNEIRQPSSSSSSSVEVVTQTTQTPSKRGLDNEAFTNLKNEMESIIAVFKSDNDVKRFDAAIKPILQRTEELHSQGRISDKQHNRIINSVDGVRKAYAPNKPNESPTLNMMPFMSRQTALTIENPTDYVKGRQRASEGQIQPVSVEVKEKTLSRVMTLLNEAYNSADTPSRAKEKLNEMRDIFGNILQDSDRWEAYEDEIRKAQAFFIAFDARLNNRPEALWCWNDVADWGGAFLSMVDAIYAHINTLRCFQCDKSAIIAEAYSDFDKCHPVQEAA